MKLIKNIISVLVIGGVLFLAYRHFFPNNEAQIRKMLNSMAADASVPAKPSAVSAMMALDRIQSCFAPEAQVTIDIPGERHYVFSDRTEIMQIVKIAWGNVRELKVQFLDINLVLDPSGKSATADLTLKVTPIGQPDFFFQELKMQLAKKENDWRVMKVDSVEVLKK